MLRESSKFEPVDPPSEPGASAARSASPSEASQARTKEVDLRAVTRGGAHDSGVPLGRELVALAESAMSLDPAAIVLVDAELARSLD